MTFSLKDLLASRLAENDCNTQL